MELDFDYEYAKIPPLEHSYWKEGKTSGCWSWTKFYGENGELAYLILVWWKTLGEWGKTKRMFRQKGWIRGSEVFYWDCLQQKWLREKEHEKFAKNKLNSRIKKVLGKDIRTALLYRYRFTYACYYPKARLKGFMLHHSATGELHFCKEQLDQLPFTNEWERISWLQATDDNPKHLRPLISQEHVLVHQKPELVSLWRLFFGGRTEYELMQEQDWDKG